MMRPLQSLLLSLLLSAPATAAAPTDEAASVRRVLDEQVAAWNRRDLEGYMGGYWRSEQLTFFGGATVTRGWQATLDRYRQKYQGEGKQMGRLSFSSLTVEVLGPDAALARGEWRLGLSGGKESKGLFTVVLRRFAEGWRVVHDHSS